MNQLPQNVFDAPAYSGRQAAHYVGVPYQTLRGWVGAEGLIVTPQRNVLSFNNLAEAHILKAMRKVHSLSLQKIRKALAELAKVRKTNHPLLDEAFETDGVSLCVRDDGDVINLSDHRQQEFREFVSLYLQRIHRDSKGVATYLYPFISSDSADEPQHVSISPKVSFGRPVLVGTGVATSLIAGRFAARDSVADLAKEYDVDTRILEDAIRWEMLRGRAA
jgi:uncharacterized protein (DUF433 family)